MKQNPVALVDNKVHVDRMVQDFEAAGQ